MIYNHVHSIMCKSIIITHIDLIRYETGAFGCLMTMWRIMWLSTRGSSGISPPSPNHSIDDWHSYLYFHSLMCFRYAFSGTSTYRIWNERRHLLMWWTEKWTGYIQSGRYEQLKRRLLPIAHVFDEIFDDIFVEVSNSWLLQEAQDFLTYYRDVLAKNKMIQNKGIYKRCPDWLLIRISKLGSNKMALSTARCLCPKSWLSDNQGLIFNARYEIDWIGREGLACETHDEFLRVSWNWEWVSFFLVWFLFCWPKLLKLRMGIKYQLFNSDV